MNRAERRRQERKQSKGGGNAAAAASAPTTGGSPRELLLLIPLLLLGVIAYANSLKGTFVLDDFTKIAESTSIKSLWDFWSDRPLIDLTLGINYQLHGLDVAGYHVVNVAIHLIAGVALFLLVRTTLTLDRYRATFERSRGWIAFAIAAIWLVHPLQTQSVTYLIQRGESLMGMFYLLTLLGVARAAAATTDSGRLRATVGAIVACTLGMLTKAIMVTAPIVAFMYDWLVVTRSIKTTLQRRWKLHLGLAATWIALGTTGIFGSMVGTIGRGATAGFSFEEFSGLEYFLTQPGVLVHYLRLSLWPHPLCLDYDWQIAQSATAIVVPGIIMVALFAITVWFVWKRSWLGFLGVWFFFILGPTSSFIPIQDVAFEHRMYLPLAAIVALVVLGVDWLRRALAVQWSQDRASLLRGVLGTFLGVVLVLGVFGTIRRNRDYHSEQRMWLTVLEINSDNPRAHTQLAKTYEEEDRNDDAIVHYERALELEPNSPVTLTNYGKVLVKTGRLEEGIAQYRRAIELRPKYVLAHNNLGNALVTARRYDEGISHLKQANSLQPGDPMVLSNLGRAHGEQGEIREAAKYLEQAIRVAPSYTAARTNLAAALLELNRGDEAIEHLVTVLQSEPTNANAANNMAIALAGRADLEAVIARYASRADLRLPHAMAYVVLGQRAVAGGDRAAAARSYRRALEIQPGLVSAQQGLDALGSGGGTP